MGKSSTGKDTIYQELLDWQEMKLHRVVPYATRPIRVGEQEGKEYHFTDDSGYDILEKQGKVIEARDYQTYHGVWRYFTVDDGNIDLKQNNYIIIGTLESYIKTAEYFGKEQVLPVLLELDDGIRLQRALDRESQQESPRYEEMCRRFLADAQDFSEEKIKDAGISKRFLNDDLKRCITEIKEYIQKNL